jgi:starch synthase (maltosyl-transferring)
MKRGAMNAEGKKRVIIENVKPEINGGRFPIKRVAGEKVVVTADVFSDGHDSVYAQLLFRKQADKTWEKVPMKFLMNDRWQGIFTVEEIGVYQYTIQGWVDHFGTWQKDLKKKFDAGQDITVDLRIGLQYIENVIRRSTDREKKSISGFFEALKKEKDKEEAVLIALNKELGDLMVKCPDEGILSLYERELPVIVDRQKALFSAWYERFPRSITAEPDRHGSLKDCEDVLPEIAGMGFDIFYLPPIHPIGQTNRKGKNNAPVAEPTDVGSPWAIGFGKGGHKEIHPDLGSIEDMKRLITKAREHEIEIAMDLAYQCSPDHPYVKEHPEWFTWRPDGTIQYAENPPKKYEDVLPLNFECDNWQELWQELKSVVEFWIGHGIRIFRVDNPHTKPFRFWEWLIGEIKAGHPGTIFLAEAFTRPKVMYYLAKAGFTQSYTYFTWRNTKKEFMDYLTELTQTGVREYVRPNFWPNTPDILPEHLQYGGRPAFLMRLVLAATLSSNYGIYGPSFELCVSDALPGKEEYINSEKFEIRRWDWSRPDSLRDVIARVNRIRRENPALQTTWNLRFHEVDNEYLLLYSKASEDLSNIILVVVNLDPHYKQAGWVKVPMDEFEMPQGQPYLVHDLVSDAKYIWHGEKNYVELDPRDFPAHIFRVRKRLKRESDFDYFM